MRVGRVWRAAARRVTRRLPAPAPAPARRTRHGCRARSGGA